MDENLKMALNALTKIADESNCDGAGRNLIRCNMIANEAIDKITVRSSNAEKSAS